MYIYMYTSLTIVRISDENSKFVHGVPFLVLQDFSKVALVPFIELYPWSSIHFQAGIAATKIIAVELQQTIVFITCTIKAIRI